LTRLKVQDFDRRVQLWLAAAKDNH